MRVGYARVSTTGQSLEVQLEALKAAGCEKVFKEKKSGKNATDRHELGRSLEFVREGDVLIVTKLDRLARSTPDLHSIAQKLQAKGAELKVLDQPELDTTTRTGKLLFSLLGAIAEFEKDLINERASEGRARAKARGVKFGRRPMLTEERSQALREEFKTWQGSAAELAGKYGLSRASLYRAVRETA